MAQHRYRTSFEPGRPAVAGQGRRVSADDLESLLDDLARHQQTLQTRCEAVADAIHALRREIAGRARALEALVIRIAQSEERAGRTAAARAIRRIARAGVVDCSEDAARHASVGGGGNGADAGAACLGERERQVLGLLAEGQRSSHIAHRLGITAGTVEVHRRNIMRKLDLHSVAALTKFAVREGLTSP